MKPLLPVTLLAALASLFVALGLAAGDQARVVGSGHDLGVASYAFGVSACETCHLPHDASGESLWAGDPQPDDDPFSGLTPLCYSCHDGTVTAGGAFVFDLSTTQHPMTPGETGEDCDMCHDPHLPDSGSFILFPSGANLCRACHARSYDTFHSLNVNAVEAGYVPQDARWSPDDGDRSGTRLWDEAGSGPGEFLKCLSCHAAHGATSSETLVTMPYRGETSSVSSLCLNCHP